MGRGAIFIAAGTCIHGAVVERSNAPFLEDPAVSKVAGKIDYSLIPSTSGEPFSQLEGLTYLIPQESTHPREAYRFLEWVMSAPVQDRQTLKGGLSVRRST
jgi:multiple sugar transport system substrate-binding protein